VCVCVCVCVVVVVVVVSSDMFYSSLWRPYSTLDTSTKEQQNILGVFLRVIMECFDFDHLKHIATVARTRLHYLTLAISDILLQEDDVDERSLDESVKTFKASNISSSPTRGLDGHFWYEKDDLGHGNDVVSPSSSRSDFS
jgi:hypothetical protein